jgi:hypothetical protein
MCFEGHTNLEAKNVGIHDSSQEDSLSSGLYIVVNRTSCGFVETWVERNADLERIREKLPVSQS